MKKDKRKNPDREERTLSMSELRVKRDDGEPPKIVGYAAVFNSLSDNLGFFREKIKKGAFKNALKTSDVRALFNHDSNFVLGRQSAGTLELRERTKGLYMEATPPDTQWANDLLVSIERGDVKEQSFAFSVKQDKWESAEKEGDPEIRTIIEVKEIFDVSPVTFPAYPDTTVATRSKDKFDAANRAGDDDEANLIEDENQQIDELMIEINTGV